MAAPGAAAAVRNMLCALALMLENLQSGSDIMRYDYPSARDVAGPELREVLASTEELLAALGDESGPVVDELRERLKRTIAEVRGQLGSSFFSNARATFSRARDTASSLNAFVNLRPWTSVGIGIGVGVLVGMLLRD